MDTPAGVPPRLAGYDVVGILGEGGSGTVYEAHADGRAIALKVLRADQAPTGRERKRWVEEAQHLARIRHPGVVQVLGMGELEDGRPYLAMEQLRGVSLAEHLAHGPLPLERALLLFDQLADAVEAIHAAGLIHRDLKPENVMLVDGGARAVLLDLGIARPAEAPPSTTTQAGYQRGTPAVMAPERFFGERATIQSDIYELAVVLFVMITGGLPWREILDAKQRLNPLTPSQVGVALPPGTEAAIMRALSTEAGERPRTVRELASQVRAAGWSGATVPAHEAAAPPPQPRAVPTESTRSSRLVPGLLLGAGLALVGGGLAYALLAGEPSQPSASAAPAPIAIDAGLVADAVIARATPIAPDASVAAAPPPVAAAPTIKPRKPRPAKPAANDATLPPAPSGGSKLPWCRKQIALYCTAEFKATEGSMSGALCKGMSDQLRTWETYPPQAAASIEDTCHKNYDAYAKAAAARIEFYENNVKPK